MKKKLGVLVVDDNERNRKLLEMILRYEGHTVIMAEDGEIAMNMLKGNTYDLVMTDLEMPKVNGIELTKFIKKYFPATKVIMVTGYHDIKPSEIAADRLIKKPFSTGEIRETIKELFNK